MRWYTSKMLLCTPRRSGEHEVRRYAIYAPRAVLANTRFAATQFSVLTPDS